MSEEIKHRPTITGSDSTSGFRLARLADAIDLLEADVAAIQAKVGQVAPEHVRHFVEQRDAAIRERDGVSRKLDEARALLELAQVQRTAAYADRDEARAEVYRLKCSMTETSKDRDTAIRERDEARAEVEKYRVKAEAYGGMVHGCAPALERAGHPVNGRGPDGAVGGIARAVEALIRERNMSLAEVERLKNELYDREQEILSLRADTVERHEPPAGSPPAAPPPGWLTEDERAKLRVTRNLLGAAGYLDEPKTIDDILARAGSPPVVEVPTVFQHSSLGDKLVALQQVKDAMDAAGIAWKEVGSE